MSDIKDLADAIKGVTGDISALVVSTRELNTGVDNVLIELQKLKDFIANGGVVTQEQLDAVVSEAQAADAAGEEAKASVEAAKAKLAAV